MTAPSASRPFGTGEHSILPRLVAILQNYACIFPSFSALGGTESENLNQHEDVGDKEENI